MILFYDFALILDHDDFLRTASATWPGQAEGGPYNRQTRCNRYARRTRPPLLALKYTLTRICSVEYTKGMEFVFEIIADPNRRAIFSLLVSSQQSLGEIDRQLG